ncbi:MAG: hypothetical protein ACLGI2_03210 [Acidimicrobiia bacterium]
MSRIVRMGLVGFVAALALAACGEGEIGGAQAAFAEEADAVCLDAQDKVGRELGDDAPADRDAVRAASDQFMQMDPPSEGETTFEIFRQSVNNLWITLQDIAQAQEVGDQPRAERARETMRMVNENIMKAADDYGMDACARGFGRAS